jgi:hypothetical protein
MAYERMFRIFSRSLNEFIRFNRRFYPFNAFRSLLGIAGGAAAPTFDGLYSREWNHPHLVGVGNNRIGKDRTSWSAVRKSTSHRMRSSAPWI